MAVDATIPAKILVKTTLDGMVPGLDIARLDSLKSCIEADMDVAFPGSGRDVARDIFTRAAFAYHLNGKFGGAERDKLLSLAFGKSEMDSIDRQKMVGTAFRQYYIPAVGFAETISLESMDEAGAAMEKSAAIAKHKGGGTEAGDSHYLGDGNCLGKRFRTGMLGELALCKFLGKDPLKFLDMELGDSHNKHGPDMERLGLRLGSKSADWGNVPLVFPRPRWPEVISVLSACRRYVHLLGIASEAVQSEFASLDLVKDDNLRRSGRKRGFFGVRRIVPMKGMSYPDLLARYGT
jgi:hypothetical protein